MVALLFLLKSLQLLSHRPACQMAGRFTLTRPPRPVERDGQVITDIFSLIIKYKSLKFWFSAEIQ